MTKTDAKFSGPELCALSARDVVSLLKSRKVEHAELIDAVEQRCSQVEPAVNAMPTTCFERARAQARHLPEAAYDGTGLAGLPVGIKDLNNVAGVRTTFGTPALSDNIPAQSDPVVQRLEERGGIVVGKTNTPEMGAGANAFNAVFGRTRNPWDTSRNAGGSSGGAAVSLITGETWLSHGSDLAGSLRTPAAYCGVVGLRPSPGRVGAGAGANQFGTEGVSGPMARDVADCALFLDAMAGFDPFDPISFPAPENSFLSAVDAASPNVKIAYSSDLNGFTHVSREMDGYMRAALDKLENAGAYVGEACPELPHLDKTYRVLRAMLWAAGPGRAPDAIQNGFKATLADNIQYGRELSIDDVYDAQINRSTIFRNMMAFLGDYDVLACPVVGLMPGPVEQEYPTEIDGVPLDDYIEWLKLSYLSTTAALPSISVPVGFSDDNMPVGIQLIGRHRDEAGLLQVARAVEMACGKIGGPIDPVVRH